MSEPSVNALLAELRSVAALASNSPSAVDQTTPSVDFANVLKSTVEQLNQVQQTSLEMQQRLEVGDESVNLQDVMISLQKASLSFQTLVQARNKLVTAYQEIMNTQV